MTRDVRVELTTTIGEKTISYVAEAPDPETAVDAMVETIEREDDIYLEELDQDQNNENDQ